MPLARFRFFSSVLVFLLAFPFPSGAFDTPLSDSAVRRAYFMECSVPVTFGGTFRSASSTMADS